MRSEAAGLLDARESRDGQTPTTSYSGKAPTHPRETAKYMLLAAAAAAAAAGVLFIENTMTRVYSRLIYCLGANFNLSLRTSCETLYYGFISYRSAFAAAYSRTSLRSSKCGAVYTQPPALLVLLFLFYPRLSAFIEA